MGKYGMTGYYEQCLEAGLEYQDFVVDALRKCTPAILVLPYNSRKYQQNIGESASGIEIKFDNKMKETGNVYIEVAEKSNAAIADFTPSGIYRNDNSWLYLIGDYEQALLFGKKQLQLIYIDEKNYDKRGIKRKEKATSQGFTYPITNAIKSGMCLNVFKFNNV